MKSITKNSRAPFSNGTVLDISSLLKYGQRMQLRLKSSFVRRSACFALYWLAATLALADGRVGIQFPGTPIGQTYWLGIQGPVFTDQSGNFLPAVAGSS